MDQQVQLINLKPQISSFAQLNKLKVQNQIKRTTTASLFPKSIQASVRSKKDYPNPTYEQIVYEPKYLNQQQIPQNHFPTSPIEKVGSLLTEEMDFHILRNEKFRQISKQIQVNQRSNLQFKPRSVSQLSPSSIPVQRGNNKLQIFIASTKRKKFENIIRKKEIKAEQDQESEQQKHSNQRAKFKEFEDLQFKNDIKNMSDNDSLQNQINVSSLQYLKQQPESQRVPMTQIYFNDAEILKAIQQKFHQNEGLFQQTNGIKKQEKQIKINHQKHHSQPSFLQKIQKTKREGNLQSLDYKLSCGGGFTSNNKFHEKSQPKCYASTILKGKLQSLLKQTNPKFLESVDQNQVKNSQKLFIKSRELIQSINSKNEKQKDDKQPYEEKPEQDKQDFISRIRRKVNSYQSLSKSTKSFINQNSFNPQIQGNLVFLCKTKNTAVEDYYTFEQAEHTLEGKSKMKKQDRNQMFSDNQKQVNEQTQAFQKQIQKQKVKQDSHLNKINNNQNKYENSQETKVELNTLYEDNNPIILKQSNENQKTRIIFKNQNLPKQRRIWKSTDGTLDKTYLSFEKNKLDSKYQAEINSFTNP